ncbi:MAG: hypothetical protein LBM96_10135 [Methanobrevibacter sp.]|jgi:hypothetical protein|nr:hypothetical protein [Candidatus Methanoflexus mossambicus]
MKTTQSDMNSTEATFRGFRTQTLYILHRIITESEKFDFLPENIEDLDVFFENNLHESVQVKNYTENLVLSHLDPVKGGSILKRIEDRYLNGITPKTKIISFGPLGPELKIGFSSESNERNALIKKLDKKGFDENIINVFFENIEFVEVNEDELYQDIIDYLKETHIGFDSNDTLDLLMNWIYNLSEKQEQLNKMSLVKKLNNIGDYLKNISSFLDEYGLSVNQLKPSYEEIDYSILKEEYSIGSHARYEHILNNLDIIRTEKLEEMSSKIREKKVLIVHGASGQGKSTVAYRFLHNYCPNALTYTIKSKNRDSLKIINTLNSISKSIDDKIVLFIDVEPEDIGWVDIVKETYFYKKFDVLVTIREEDWKKCSLRHDDVAYSEMELTLNKKEAENIYNSMDKKDKLKFLDFEECWSVFGGEGPLLEFTYLLTYGITLRDRLKKQINTIQKESLAENNIEKIHLLGEISILGMYGCKTDLGSLSEKYEPYNLNNIIELFQKEYLIRKDSNSSFIDCLHPIRSEIIVDILFDSDINPIKNKINDCLSIIYEKNIEKFLIGYFNKYFFDEDVLNQINSYFPKSWLGYGLVIKSLIWLGVKEYFLINKKNIQEINDKLGSYWNILIGIDIGGAIENETHEFFNNELFDQKDVNLAKKIKNNFSDKKSVYRFLMGWFEKSFCPLKFPKSDDEWEKLGLSLFWLGKLGIRKDIPINHYDFFTHYKKLSLNSIANFLLGLHYFEPSNEIIINGMGKILDRFQNDLLIPAIEETDEEIKIHCIIDSFEIQNAIQYENIDELILERLDLFRNLFPYKKTYSLQSYGEEFTFSKDLISNTKKEIPSKNISLSILTEINGIYHDFIDQKFGLNSWDNYINQIIEHREYYLKLTKRLIQSIELYYKTPKKINIFESNGLNSYFSRLDSISNVKMPNQAKKIFRFDNYVKISEKFFGALKNFFNQSMPVIMTKLETKGKTNEKIILKKLEANGIRTDLTHVSFVYLHDIYKNLKLFQNEFKILFNEHLDKNFIEKLEADEKTNYYLLLGIWDIFAKEKYKRDKRIIRNSKNKVSKAEKFSENIAKSLENDCNLEVINHDDEKYFSLDINSPFEFDEGLNNILDTLFEILKDIEYTNLKHVFLDINCEHFIIVPLIKGKILYPMAFQIPLYKFIGDKTKPNLEIMTLLPKPIEKIPIEFEIWENYIDDLEIANKIFTMAVIPHMIYYLKQVNELAELEDKYINHAVLDNFTLNFSKKISETFQEAIVSNEFLINKLSEEAESLLNSNIGNEEYETQKQIMLSAFNIFKESNDILNSLMDDKDGNINISLKLGNKETIGKLEELEFKANQLHNNFMLTHAYFSNKWISEFF